MARSLRVQFPGAFYHLTCRGVERRKIFADDTDRYKFLSLLSGSLAIYQVVLYAYIMMENHFHLLVQTKKANLSEFMRHFNICYTGWFNYRHGRSGNLYQGRYKSFLVAADSYLLEVSRYLHLNSVRVRGLRSVGYQQRGQYLRGYRWSSLLGYLDAGKVVNFVDYDLILFLVGGRGAYRQFVIDGLKRALESPFKEIKSGLILGDDDFVAWVKTEYVKSGSFRDQPSYRSLMEKVIKPEVVIECVVRGLGIEKERLVVRFGTGIERGIVSELLYRYSGLTQREIGRLLGAIDYSAVNKLRRRLLEKMSTDKATADRYASVEHEILKRLSIVEI